MKVAAVVALLAVLVAGCSSGGGGNTPSISAPSTSSSAAPSTTAGPPTTAPTVWTIPQARTHYLTIIKAHNSLAGRMQALGQNPPLAALTGLCREFAMADDAAARQMAAGAWPTSARSAIGAFVTAITRERVDWISCASATNTSDAYTDVNDATKAASAQAEAVRIALGLPASS